MYIQALPFATQLLKFVKNIKEIKVFNYFFKLFKCKPLSGFALNSGGYECYCSGGFRYPQDFEGPYKGIHLIDVNNRKYPLCIKSEALLQFPNWINRYNPDNSYDRTFGGTDYIYVLSGLKL